MIGNANKMNDPESLTAKQLQFVTALAQGRTTVDAAKDTQISEATAWRWLKQPAIQFALQQARNEMLDEAFHILRLGVKKSISALAKHITADVEPTASSQIAAAHLWLKFALEIHKASELEMQNKELIERLDRLTDGEA
jgi:phage terminase small subunit